MGISEPDSNPRLLTAKWNDVIAYGPAPRHRRRLILQWIRDLPFRSCLDAGCAQPYLLQDIQNRFAASVFGCDWSEEVIASNRRRLPSAEFQVIDLSQSTWPEGKEFDLVISSEVLEHIQDWERALENLTKMCGRYLLLTVPSGKVHAIDRHIGHWRHFAGPELLAATQKLGFLPRRTRYWGFPFHTAYKYAINGLGRQSIYDSFGVQSYGPAQRFISDCVYWLFFANDPFASGGQFMVLAERP